MRSDRHKKPEKTSRAGTNRKKMNFPTGLAIVYGLALLVFIVTLFILDVMPMKFLLPIVLVLLIISALVLKPLLLFNPKKKTARNFCEVVAVLLIIVFATGIYYVGGTLSFFGKISGTEQTQNFYVVAKADSTYEKIRDIDGVTVGTMKPDDEIYQQAREKLQKEVDVTFAEKGGFNELCKGLIEGESEVIFFNSAYYDIATEEIEGFTKDNTKVIGEIDIKTEKQETAKKVDVVKDSFNVYISGIDTTGSISNVSRSDVNMVATINPKTKTILLTSIPRDYYVMLASKQSMDKLTHSGIYGIDETVGTVENLLGIDINYYVKVNFTTVTSLVNTLGGINVNSDFSFSAGGYTFQQGMNYMNGEQALAFARERYSFSSGDRQRVKNQQAVITGIINKVTGSSAILLKYNEILGSIDNNMQTNMSSGEITALVKMQLNDMSGWTIKTCSLDGSGKMTPVYSAPHQNVYVMVPKQETVDNAKALIEQTMNAGE